MVQVVKFHAITLVLRDRSALEYRIPVENNHCPCRNIENCDGTHDKVTLYIYAVMANCDYAATSTQKDN